MATSSIVFVALVVFATTIPIAAFAWVAGNKRQKDPSATPDNIQQSVKADPPQFRRREAWADEPPPAALRMARSRHLGDRSMGPVSTGRRPPQRGAGSR